MFYECLLQQKENQYLNEKTTWEDLLNEHKKKKYFKNIIKKIACERKKGKIIYPRNNQILSALENTTFERTKVVILGQDPYHGNKQAHGLSFSVQQGTPAPPSLKNIFKELKSDLNIENSNDNGCLLPWAKQGVLLLNSILTVEAGLPLSHKKWGWQYLTDAIIELLNYHPKGIVYMLWGASAQRKKILINPSKHLILCSAHPSPLSAYRGFIGNRHFSKANTWLKKSGRSTINWQL